MLSVLLKALMATATKALMALGTQAVLEWALFFVLEKFVSSTKTQSDDRLLEEFKKSFNKIEKGEG